jgi:hypothetical protein
MIDALQKLNYTRASKLFSEYVIILYLEYIFLITIFFRLIALKPLLLPSPAAFQFLVNQTQDIHHLCEIYEPYNIIVRCHKFNQSFPPLWDDELFFSIYETFCESFYMAGETKLAKQVVENMTWTMNKPPSNGTLIAFLRTIQNEDFASKKTKAYIISLLNSKRSKLSSIRPPNQKPF